MPSDSPKDFFVEAPHGPDDRSSVESAAFISGGLPVVVGSSGWRAEVVFNQTYGFRVLDELDIAGFRSECTLAAGGLFEVDSGGCKNIEITCPSFKSGRQSWVREYFIGGRNECVSVLTKVGATCVG